MADIRAVADLLKRHAEERGQQVAFSGPRGRTVTYADLAARTSRIAIRLQAVGVTRGCRVAIVLGSCVEAVESIYAITRASAVGVLLDPRSSQAELTKALKRSSADVVFTDSQRLSRVCAAISDSDGAAERRTTVVVVDRASADLELGTDKSGPGQGFDAQRFEDWAAGLDSQNSIEVPRDDLGLDEPAWLQYTTGTTGEPKGVVSSQRAWMWTAAASYIPSLGLTSADKLFWPLPLFHAFGHSLCTIGTLAIGATTHLAGDEPQLDSLRKHTETTILAGAPASFRELVTTTDVAAREVLSLIRPRACVNAGAAPPAGLSAGVKVLFGTPLINHYGCTECGLIATTSPGDSYDEDSCGPVVPGINVQIRAVTSDGQLSGEVAGGEEGEICVRTPSFMLGYDGNELVSSQTEDGWYRTGDLGRMKQNILTVTGRLKELIIRGGENIHPGEVEEALRTCADVADVVVIGLPHDMLGEVPAAFVVPKSAAGVNMTTLLAACRAVLPDYKVPVKFYTIDAVPHTASGKPKRRAVLELLRKDAYCKLLAAPFLDASMVGPLVLGECNAVCGGSFELNEQLDPEQTFMSLGLNSMKSVVLRDRLASLTGLDLPITMVFDYPTPAAVSHYLVDRLFGVKQSQSQGVPHQVPVGLNDGSDAIAIISMNCRYPGGISSPEDLWHVVSHGMDVTSDFPTNRGWDIEALYDPDPNRTGTCIAQRGGFIHDMADFDAGFFGMSPREALATDPQQRILLETTHTLIERARIAPSSLRGSPTGVFIGMIYSDYVSRFNHGNGKGHEHEAHLDIGASPSVAAGRISYSFDFKGPSMAIDAACSSSLSAIHLAAASLQTGESTLAIAGGVTIMSTPRQFIAFSRQRGLSTDGRCRPYSADANGTGWSEGVGLVLLERLSDARRNGHTVLSLVRGSAVNSDGTSFGLTVPSGPAQQEVIKQTLRRAALSPADIDVLDGHGTATSLGDPIELRAVLATYGDKSKRTTPLLVGSVKSNIGHTQAAAGIASVIKMVKAMEHGIAPASIHVSKPTPHVDWKSGALELLSEARQWPQASNNRPRRAAVSSFGISGTNAHVILEHPGTNGEQDHKHPASAKTVNCYPWLLSGADEAALRAQARAMAISCKTRNAVDVAFSLATTRSQFSQRAAVMPTSGDDLYEALIALAKGQTHSHVFTGLAGPGRSGHSRTQSRVAFIFSGQGSQRLGMGQKLRARFPRFDAAFLEICKELDPQLQQPLSEVINSSSTSNVPGQAGLLDRADFAQAAVFTFEVAMYRLLESFGIRPDYVAGHSLGEIAAAHVSGYLSLADAAALVSARGSLMAALPEGGTMASISATEGEIDKVNKVLRDLGVAATSVVAAVNASNSVVVSGPTDAVLAVKDLFAAQGRPATQLRVSHAFHSPMMEPVSAALGQVVGRFSSPLSTSSPKIPLVSTLTGKLINASDLTPEHWARHVLAPVRFADAIDTLSTEAGVTIFAEIGPSAPLGNYMPDSIATSDRKQDEVDVLLRSLGQLWARGIQPEQGWECIFHGTGARISGLPVYPFQRRRYWLDSQESQSDTKQEAAAVKNLALEDLPPSPISRPVSSPDDTRGLETEPGHFGLRSPTTTASTDSGSVLSSASWEDQLSKLSPDQRRVTLLGLVKEQVSAVLGYEDNQSLPESALDTPFTELGCDSYMGTMLRGRLGQLVGVLLPINLTSNEATASTRSLVEYLLARMVFVV